MPKRVPLVLDDAAQVQRLQPGDEADIPLQQRFDEQTVLFRLLLKTIVDNDLMLLPDELIEESEKL